MNVTAFRRLTAKPRNKYHAKPERDAAGQHFASKAELRRFNELQLLERAGEIRGLKRQVKFPLFGADLAGQRVPLLSPTGRQRSYVADATYYDRAGRFHVEDTKGRDTPLSEFKRELVRLNYGIAVELVR